MELHTAYDLTNCDKEPIHVPGSIQSHGFLLAIDERTMTVSHVSQNLTAYTKQTPASVLGKPVVEFDKYVQANTRSSFSELLEFGMKSSNFELLNPQRVSVDGKAMFLILHKYQGYVICEFEPEQHSADEITLQKIMSTALSVIQSSATFTKLLERVANLVKDISGYDRVMIYKFHEDEHGEVIAESRNEDMESWLHLHYPASDIPAQARELYKLNLVRIIANVGSQPSGLLAEKQGPPLDLTHSVLRAVSPIHIEYLKNMQVGASFSISLLSKDRLWGLIACHSNTPKFIDYNSRIACKFIGQLFSAALEFKSEEVDEDKVTRIRQRQQFLFEQVLKDQDTSEALLKKPVNLLTMSNAEGVVYVSENKMQSLGKVPSTEEIAELIDWVRTNNHESFFQTNSLPLQFKPAKNFRDVASGVMVIFLSHDKNDYIAWFKPEKIKSVAWAGEPSSAKTVAADGRISPRKSFEKWTEEVSQTSDAWSDTEIFGAIKLREDLIQLNNKKAGEIKKLNELLQNAYDELDTFSFTISHDLRTPLSSIRNYTEIILEDHEKQLDPEAKELFAKVIRGTDKMAQLIRNVLQYSRVGRTNVEAVPINMSSLLNEIKDEILSGVKDRKVKIEIGNTPDLRGDNTMIMQLFTNLISNAVKYSTNAGESRVEVNGERSDGAITYTVSDNGIGIDMKFANRIFELFRRLDNVKNIEGTGVGLAIAKRIVEKHDGKIWLESRPGHGTKFYISLPDNNKPDNA